MFSSHQLIFSRSNGRVFNKYLFGQWIWRTVYWTWNMFNGISYRFSVFTWISWFKATRIQYRRNSVDIVYWWSGHTQLSRMHWHFKSSLGSVFFEVFMKFSILNVIKLISTLSGFDKNCIYSFKQFSIDFIHLFEIRSAMIWMVTHHQLIFVLIQKWYGWSKNTFGPMHLNALPKLAFETEHSRCWFST